MSPNPVQSVPCPMPSLHQPFAECGFCRVPFFYLSYGLAFSHCTAISHTPPFSLAWFGGRSPGGIFSVHTQHSVTCNPRRTKHLLVPSLWFRSNKNPPNRASNRPSPTRVLFFFSFFSFFLFFPFACSCLTPLPPSQNKSVPDLPGAVNFQASGNGLRFPTQTTGSRPQSLVLAYPSRWDASERADFL
ncbi:hypothetical protein BGZ61DRAFT_235542 [Ilyonectria robusta]|uniref:uncharacterized protein n=1 Tax=Ilyonectria robusta TaxID=1079257 RepID=UPI001E8EC8B2|nr:uncharacterized protein BGZ61DRAFT_235542 [Ilyonectria robusta]KAH8699681.1 hypothetical protein BGZ61DRAFT_235542 [Ilyonectria robusta]